MTSISEELKKQNKTDQLVTLYLTLTLPPPGTWWALSSEPTLAWAFSLKSSFTLSIFTRPPPVRRERLLNALLKLNLIYLWWLFPKNDYSRQTIPNNKLNELYSTSDHKCERNLLEFLIHTISPISSKVITSFSFTLIHGLLYILIPFSSTHV